MLLQPVPDDMYGVLVENDMDRRRLLWLVQKIGEIKLRRSVAKYNNRYPDCRPYVSVLLKWYRLKVPVSVYAPVRVPIYSVYMFVLSDESAIKIGMSGDVVQRCQGMQPSWLTHIGKMFNFDKSFSFATLNKRAALASEKSILNATKYLQCSAPIANEHAGRIGVIWGAGGKREWRHGHGLSQIEDHFAKHAHGAPLISLRESIRRSQTLWNMGATAPS